MFLFSYQISCCKNILWINRRLQTFYHIDSCFSDTLHQKFLSQLTHSMMMWDRSAVFHNLFSGRVLNLIICSHWIGQALINEPKVNVNTCSCVVDLSYWGKLPGWLWMKWRVSFWRPIFCSRFQFCCSLRCTSLTHPSMEVRFRMIQRWNGTWIQNLSSSQSWKSKSILFLHFRHQPWNLDVFWPNHK